MSVWSKIYERINWKDLPQRLTALAARNLNKMDLAIDTLDDRVIALDSGKVGSVEVTNTLPTGDTIATITVDGTATAIKVKQPNESEMNVRSAMLLLSTTPIGENAPFVKRRSGGNVPFPALLKDKIIGASVVWNQLEPLDETKYNVTRASISLSNGIYTLSPSSDSTTSIKYAVLKGSAFTLISGHKYYISASGKVNDTEKFCAIAVGDSNLATTVDIFQFTSSSFEQKSAIITADSTMPYFAFRFGRTSTTALSANVKNITITDLTAMFGSTIADYVNTLETQTAGSGIAWLKSYGFFAEDYYAYSANKIESVSVSGKKNVGKNLYDKSRTFPYFYGYMANDNTCTANAAHFMTYIEVLPNTYYTASRPRFAANERFGLALSNELPSSGSPISQRVTATTTGTVGDMMSLTRNSQNFKYLIIWAGWNDSGADNVNNSLQVEIGQTATTYEPYKEWQTSLDHTTLRGLFKLDTNNNLYADGDIYPSDGTESVRYALYDMGNDMSWTYQSANTRFYSATLANVIDKTNASYALCEPYIIGTSFNVDKTILMASSGNIFVFDSNYTDATIFTNAMKGKKLLIKLATTTTATLTPYQSLQNIENGGTEEFIDYGVSQGTRDVAIPVGGEREYYQGMEIPALPTASGNHNLQFNPSSGFSWS